MGAELFLPDGTAAKPTDDANRSILKYASRVIEGEVAGVMPTFVAAGSGAGGLGNVSPGLPAGLAENDILILFVASANQPASQTNT
jgi:hypothetical protein